MKLITPSYTVKLLKQNAYLIDVSNPAEYNGCYIPESKNYPLQKLLSDIKSKQFANPDDRLIIVTCQSGNRAQLAAKAFQQTGFQVEILQGGNQAWIESGYDVIRGEGVISLERQIRIVAGSIGLIGSLLAYLVAPLFFLMPAIIGAGLLNAGVTNWCGMGMLLSKMPWNRATNVTSTICQTQTN